jgi:hypothetical protein
MRIGDYEDEDLVFENILVQYEKTPSKLREFFHGFLLNNKGNYYFVNIAAEEFTLFQ